MSDPATHSAPSAVAPAGGVLAVILAGGLARRMGGGDKGARPIAGRPMLTHVIERLAAQIPNGRADLILNANGDPARFAPYELPVVADPVGDHDGPLAGILAGMEAAAARGRAWVLTAAADTPFLPSDLAARLTAAAAEQGLDVAFAATPDMEGALRAHPTFGLWRAELADLVRRALVEDGERKIVRVAARARAADIAFPTPDPDTGLDPFFNVNTPEDLVMAERALAPRAPVSGGAG